jgi:hypothetical protein
MTLHNIGYALDTDGTPLVSAMPTVYAEMFDEICRAPDPRMAEHDVIKSPDVGIPLMLHTRILATLFVCTVCMIEGVDKTNGPDAAPTIPITDESVFANVSLHIGIDHECSP